MTKYLRRKIMKFFVYAVIVFMAYIIQTTPGLFDFYGIKPILVLPACICIAVYEGEFAGGLLAFSSEFSATAVPKPFLGSTPFCFCCSALRQDSRQFIFSEEAQ